MRREMPLKHLARIAVSNVDKKSDDDERPVRLCNYTDVYYNERITASLEFMAATASESQIRDFRLRPGDVLITKDSETPDDIAAPALVEEGADDLVCGYHLALIRADETLIDPRFLFWALATTSARRWFSSQATGVTRFGLRAQSIGDARISLPPVSAQAEIADYLDRETRRIDALIEKKRQLATSLDARSVTLVRESVLHSRNTFALLGRLGRILRGTTFPHGYQGRSEGEIAFFKVNDMAAPGNETRLGMPEHWISRADATELGARIVPRGSVAFPRVGAAMLLNPRRLLTIDAVVDDNILAFTPYAGDPRFWRYWLTTVDLASLANPGPVPSVTEAQLRTLRVPVIDASRQVRIADQLDEKMDSTSRLLAKLSRQAELLLEHRQALITAAVTGQLDLASRKSTTALSSIG